MSYQENVPHPSPGGYPDDSPSQRRSLPPWSQEVRQHVIDLRNRVGAVPSDYRWNVEALVDEADQLATERVPWRRWSARVWDWWYGSRVERAWACLHEADLLIVEYGNDYYVRTTALENAVAHADLLDPKDPIRLRLTNWVNQLPDQNADQVNDRSEQNLGEH